MRNTSNSNTNNNNTKEREREKKYRRLRCNTNRKSSALSALFRVLRALEGVVVFLNVSRRRRRPIGFKRVTPFPHPNYLGSQNRCVFSPKISPSFFTQKARAKVTSCPFVATYSGTRLPACLSFPRLRRHCRSGTPPPPVVFGRLFAASCRHDSMTRMKPLVVGVVTRRRALNGGCLQNTIEL